MISGAYFSPYPLTKMVCRTGLMMLDRRMWYWFKFNPLIGIFLHSPHLSAGYCIIILRRNSVVVELKSYAGKGKI